ncbi:CvpA family protein [Candidatus Curculioniphilus buchneri]|uniref:CvpA family protein n=1 Tax=Candidatus Curculioniphilus buchneri TaxID=690594 RepID=UPI00376F3D0A
MIWLDYVIIAVIFLSTFISFIRGLVREVLSLVNWASAIFITSHYYHYAAHWVFSHFFEQVIIQNATAIILVFLITLIIGGYINHIIYLMIKQTDLSHVDRVLGICFGILRGILIGSAMLYLVDRFTNWSHSKDWNNTYLIQQANDLIRIFFNYLIKKYSILILFINSLIKY